MLLLDYASYSFGDDELIVRRVDDVLIRYPRRLGWELLATTVGLVTGDFMPTRDQPSEPDGRLEL